MQIRIFSLEVMYTGKPSHAAGFPWEGVNALDAAVMCFNSIACLRQQMKPEWRVHCRLHSGLLAHLTNEPHHEKICLLGVATRKDANQLAQLQRQAKS